MELFLCHLCQGRSSSRLEEAHVDSISYNACSENAQKNTQMFSLSTQWGGSRRRSYVYDPNKDFVPIQIFFETKQKPELEGDAGHFDES